MTDRNAGFSLVAFAVALVTVGVGTAAGLAFVPVVGTYLGTLVGGLVAGLALEKRPVIESGVAAVVAGLGVLAAGPFLGNGVVAGVTSLTAVGPLTLLVSVALSFAVGAFGGHFGDDLRDGLTEPVESTAGSTDIGTTPVPPPSGSAADERTETEPTDRRTDTAEAAEEPAEASDGTELELERND